MNWHRAFHCLGVICGTVASSVFVAHGYIILPVICVLTSAYNLYVVVSE